MYERLAALGFRKDTTILGYLFRKSGEVDITDNEKLLALKCIFLMVSSISLTTIGPLLLSKKETFLVLTEMATSLYFSRRANGQFLLNS